MHPDDLAQLGLESGEVAEISSARATILGVVEADDDDPAWTGRDEPRLG